MDKVSIVILNLSFKFVEIEGQFFEGGLLEFCFESEVLLPVVSTQSYENKYKSKFLCRTELESHLYTIRRAITCSMTIVQKVHSFVESK